MDRNELYTYFYSVADRNGFPITATKKLNREEFISETGMDPLTYECVYT